MFARLPIRRFWIALGGSVLAAWGPWWAVMGWEATHHLCDSCRTTMALFAALGPTLPGLVLADELLELAPDGVGVWAVGGSSAAAFVAALTAAGWWLPRGRWAAWLAAAAMQGWFAWIALAVIRL